MAEERQRIEKTCQGLAMPREVKQWKGIEGLRFAKEKHRMERIGQAEAKSGIETIGKGLAMNGSDMLRDERQWIRDAWRGEELFRSAKEESSIATRSHGIYQHFQKGANTK